MEALRRMRMRRIPSRAAQAAMELAIFGAITLFVIGLLLKTGLNMSHQTNIQLRAFRRALLESYQTSQGLYSGTTKTGIAARNSASVTILEDRLSIDPDSKTWTSDRFPVFGTGSGSFSVQMMYPAAWGTDENIPVMDMFINGQRFVFSMAGFRTIDIDDYPQCSTMGAEDRGIPCQSNGRLIVWKRTTNYLGSMHWCGNVANCPNNIPGDWRFDLDLDGTTDIALDEQYLMGRMLRNDFAWQWMLAALPSETTEGVNSTQRAEELREAVSVNMGGTPVPEVPTLEQGDVFFMRSRLDAQGRAVFDTGSGAVGGPVTFSKAGLQTVGVDEPGRVRVLDYNAGNVFQAMTRQEEAACQEGGGCVEERNLSQNLQIFSYTGDGTFLQNIEGSLYDDDGVERRFVRHHTRRHHLDIIQRVFFLNSDLGRFCDNGRPTQWTAAMGLAGLTNPVEACGGCMAPGRQDLTCLEPDGRLFIRSRILDLRGRRWETDFEP